MNLDTFEATCVRVGRHSTVPYSVWREVNAEGIITEITFRYPECNGIEDKVGDTITMSLHLDEDGNAVSRQPDTVEAL